MTPEQEQKLIGKMKRIFHSEEIEEKYLAPQFMEKLFILNKQVSIDRELMDLLLELLQLGIDDKILNSNLLDFLDVPLLSEPLKEGELALIHLAAKYGLSNLVEHIVHFNPGFLNIRDSFGQTPLIFAASYGHLKTVEYLLEEDADLSIESQIVIPTKRGERLRNWTALNFAVEKGQTAVVALLVDRMLNPLGSSGEGAREKVSIPAALIARLPLLHKGKNTLNKSTIERALDLIRFDKAGELSDALFKEIFKEWGDFGKSKEKSPIFYAARHNLVSVLTKLVRSNPGLVNAQDSLGRTPLKYAVWYGHTKLVEFLLAEGADPFIEDKIELHWTALNWAIEKNNTKIIRLLVTNILENLVKVDPLVRKRVINLFVSIDMAKLVDQVELIAQAKLIEKSIDNSKLIEKLIDESKLIDQLKLVHKDIALAPAPIVLNIDTIKRVLNLDPVDQANELEDPKTYMLFFLHQPSSVVERPNRTVTFFGPEPDKSDVSPASHEEMGAKKP